MAITKDRLASIISGKAAKLCSSESQKQIRAMGSSISNRLDEATMQGDDMAAQYEAMLGYNSDDNDGGSSKDITFTSADAQMSNLPEHIKKSMLEHNIDRSGLGGASVLDSMGIKPKKGVRNVQRTPITEQQQMPQQYAVPAMPNNVDYSIIKAVVNECLKEYFGKQPLNEGISALETVALKGKTISLVDNKGNIYQGNLKLIGNTNDKKQ